MSFELKELFVLNTLICFCLYAERGPGLACANNFILEIYLYRLIARIIDGCQGRSENSNADRQGIDAKLV